MSIYLMRSDALEVLLSPAHLRTRGLPGESPFACFGRCDRNCFDKSSAMFPCSHRHYLERTSTVHRVTIKAPPVMINTQ